MIPELPGSRRGVRNQFAAASREVKAFFDPIPELIANKYPLEVSLAYAFARLEQAHRTTLYGGVVKRENKILKKAAAYFAKESL